jgi:hypothetical protein
MHKNRDEPMQLAIRMILKQVVGPQARLARRPDGAIVVTPKARKVLVVPDGDRLLVVPDGHDARRHLNDLGPDGFALRYRERAAAGELCDPRFRGLRFALREHGYADLFDEGAGL